MVRAHVLMLESFLVSQVIDQESAERGARRGGHIQRAGERQPVAASRVLSGLFFFVLHSRCICQHDARLLRLIVFAYFLHVTFSMSLRCEPL